MRATIDLDDPTDMEILKVWNRLENHGDGEVYGRVSSSGSGVHLKVHGCDEATADELRRMYDDQKRRRFDADSDLKPKQILFSSKPDGGVAGTWTQDRERVLAEYRRRADPTVRYPNAPRPGRW